MESRNTSQNCRNIKLRKTTGIAKESAYLPKIRSMRDYIEQHYKDELISELGRALARGEIPQLYDSAHGRPRRESLCMGSGEIVQVTFWRQSGYEVLAEIVIVADVLRVFSRDGIEIICRRRMEYHVSMWIFLEDDIECEYGRFRINCGPTKREGRLLNEYLIPYLSREDIEEEAENILRLKWPEARLNAGCLNPRYVTQALGLRVVNLPLYKREKTQSILYFCEGDAIIEDTRGMPKTVRVGGNTIVINTKHPNCCNEKAAIFHECFHFLEHRLFYKLQRMTVADEKLMPKWIPHEERKHDGHPVEWMEWQARYGAQCLMMPRSLVRPFVDKQLKAMERLAMHGGEKMDLIGRALADEFNVWKYFARNRLLQLGYAAARGALNYVNDSYVRPFAFSLGECRKGETFVIGTADAFREYINNEAFRDILDSGHFVYVDGHYCLDVPEYVRHTPKGLQMTDWANAHVDQCCLRFVIHYTRDKLSEYKYGQLNSNDEFNGRNLTLSMQEDASVVLEKAIELSEELQALPASFHGTLKVHMQRCGITQEDMAASSQISERTIRRLRSEERTEYSLDQVVAICLALHLPPEFSSDLIKKAGFTMRDIPQHLIYRAILRTMFTESVETVQARLKECGCRQLRLKDQGYAL